ncbi:MAG: hypothetical protein RQ867_04880 [Mariprofundaceae bacterium]|nr:hypothetical protein [Mariprofundaceae bacterium]
MRIITGTLLIGLALSISACGLMAKPEAGAPKKPMSATSGEAVNQATPVNMIAEFDDIPVPVELSRKDEESSVYEAPGFAVGVIVYEGYYKSASISKFFRAEMPKYEWQFINAFSEGSRYTLTFLKANRSCSISIEEGSLSTRMVIRVGPTGG